MRTLVPRASARVGKAVITGHDLLPALFREGARLAFGHSRRHSECWGRAGKFAHVRTIPASAEMTMVLR
ncbi:hypothetical protein COC42_07750 [Sphingomonas spermidinifaciens]|uniref:Uncharacterized protein n=1 Tax=Sphingomonas spermidinifaciens TaxID=1141889 RepID=A0A2A4B949_9SPHN|nr:hypothetical protein COC42_07750 [Sphingomonas spermidinifaciens]